jgi:hypothetical protein
LDEREVVRGELIVARSDATTLFDFVKEALDEIAGSVEMRTEADWIVAIAFWWDVGPSALASSVRAKRFRQIAPGGPGSQ